MDNEQQNRIDLVVIGQGYVGLPLAQGSQLIWPEGGRLRRQPRSGPSLNAGISHIDDLSDEDISTMRLQGYEASADPEVLSRANTIVVCVPTPLSKDGSPDMKYVESAAATVASNTWRSRYLVQLRMVELECIARGPPHQVRAWLTTVPAAPWAGMCCRPGLRRGLRLEPAIFTPSTKADPGEHDENITMAQARERLGEELTEQLESLTLAVFERARRIADGPGVVTRRHQARVRPLSRGRHPDARRRGAHPGLQPLLVRGHLHPGRTPPSLDKQFVRNWLTSPASG